MIARRALILIAPLVAVGACTSILGDFTTGPVVESGDGGDATMGTMPEAAPDVGMDRIAAEAQGPDGAGADRLADQGAGDQALADQGLSDQAAPDTSDGPAATPPDGAGEAGVTLRRLRCLASSATSGQRTPLTTGFPVHPSNPGIIRIGNLANRQVRVALVDTPPPEGGMFNPSVLQAYTFDPNNSSSAVAQASFATNSGQILDLERYGGAVPGFVALFVSYDQTQMTSVLSVARLPDDSNAWIGPKSFGPVPNNLNNSQAVLTAIDGSQDSYYVVMSYITGGSQIVSAGPLNAANPKLPPITTYTAMNGQDAFQLVNPGIALAGAGDAGTTYQPYVIMQPNGQNGPPPLGSAAALLVPGAATLSVAITPPSTLNYFPAGLVSAAADSTKANIFMLVADLTQLQGNYRVGQVAASSLPSLDPMSLPITSVTAADGGTASIRDLLINNTMVHWETPPMAGEQLLALSPPVDLNMGFPGISFGWWDAPTGQLRTYAAGDGALLSDVANIVRADATFVSLVGSIGQLYVAYEVSSTPSTGMNGGNNAPACDIWLARVNCTP
jgi:hypothetical protein